MGPIDRKLVEHCADVRGSARLGIAGTRRRHARGRITAGVVGYTAIASRKVAQLRLPTAAVAGKLVHEYDGSAAAHVLVIELNIVVGGQMGHGAMVRI